MERTIRVPLAVDANIRVPVGTFMLPLRSLALAGIVAPLAYAIFMIGAIPISWRLGVDIFILLLAATVAIPTKEGIWIGTWNMYQFAYRVLPSLIDRGRPMRARVSIAKEGVKVAEVRGTYESKRKGLRVLNQIAGLPKISTTEIPGVFMLEPGGARAILKIEGPPVSLSSDTYLSWCTQVMNWISSVDVPAQMLTLMTHYDVDKAQAAFDQRVDGWPRTPLFETERALAGYVAQATLGLQHYLILSPQLAGPDGIPPFSKLTRMSRAIDAKPLEAEHALQSAKRMAGSFGITVEIPDRDELASVVSKTVLGARTSVVGNDVLRVGDQFQRIITMTKLPPNIEVGSVVDALMRAQSRGIISLHMLPVSQVIAQKHLHKRSGMLNYAMKKGGDVIESQVALQETTEVIAAMAQRSLKPMRLALTIAVSHHELDKVDEAAERLRAILAGLGFGTEQVTGPGFLPALALSPGSVPLGRSILLTSDTVALRMLPALGTPFSDVTAPLLGVNALNGAPAYFSIWTPPNHNLVIVGSSGAGKSVTAKTMLIRHIMEGVSAVIIDPDSEYRPAMRAIGGQYYELGEDALNPFSAGVGVPADTAASLVLPILSVMGGDEKGVRDGRPIRRLPDEDQGWLHGELAAFYTLWNQAHRDREPVMSDVIRFIETEGMARTLTQHEQERCRIITARLRRYTQGQRAKVFDRPSTFSVGQRPVAIGLKVFAMTYGADLTPALAVVLTSILAAVERKMGRMIVAVDEAHRVTSDPDAGEVLGQLVRQARKYGAGVWMMSQRVEDFVRTDLGRTLAATASTKFILGTEEAVLEEVAEVFKLRPEEVKAINPMSQGRGVLLSGSERTIVNVTPGPGIMALSDTSNTVRDARRRRVDVDVMPTEMTVTPTGTIMTGERNG